MSARIWETGHGPWRAGLSRRRAGAAAPRRRALRRFAGRNPRVQVVERAVTAAAGRATLAVSERTPTVSTLATEWRNARAQEPDFGDVSWNQAVEVTATTLDALIEEFGRPAFVKIDVEGGELGVLQGLSTAVPALSFEFLPRALDAAQACVARVEAIGPYQFNWSMAESSVLALPRWVPGPALLETLQAEPPSRHGDIYARLGPPRAR